MKLFYPHSYYSYVIICNYYHYPYDHHHHYHYHYYYYYCYHCYYCSIIIITIIIAITIMIYIYICIYLSIFLSFLGITQCHVTHIFSPFLPNTFRCVSWWNPRWPGGALVRDAGALLSPCRWRSQEGGPFEKNTTKFRGDFGDDISDISDI